MKKGLRGSDSLCPQSSGQLGAGGLGKVAYRTGCLRPQAVSRVFLWRNISSDCHHLQSQRCIA